jgi:hypothetical protein
VDASTDKTSFTGGIIEVHIGDRIFKVHENVLGSSSKLLSHALSPECRSEAGGPMELSGIEADDFFMYGQWLYSSSVPQDVNACAFFELAKLYVLGERLQDTTLKNFVLDAMCSAAHSHGPSLSAIRLIYSNTEAGSPARRLLVDMSACQLGDPRSRRVQDLDPAVDADFMKDWIAALVELRPCVGEWDLPWVAQRQQYRVIDDEEVYRESKSTVKISVPKKGGSSTTNAMDTTA